MNQKKPLLQRPQLVVNFEKPKDQHSSFTNLTVGPVDVLNIDTFDGNPRHARDTEKYVDLKESIRAKGVLFPIQIAKQPNSTRFIVARGGNTRLTILKELYAETANEKYRYIRAQEVEYTNEADMFISHMIENEQRADMAFWDRAQGYYRACHSLHLTENASHREIEQRLQMEGLSISHARIGLFFFAVRKLSKLGQLADFLSASKALDLRKHFNELEQLSFELQQVQGHEATFDLFWDDQLSRFAQDKMNADDFEVDDLLQLISVSFAAHWTRPAQPSFSDVCGANDTRPSPSGIDEHVNAASNARAGARSDPAMGFTPSTAHLPQEASKQTETNMDSGLDALSHRDRMAHSTSPLPLSKPQERSQLLLDLQKSVAEFASIFGIEDWVVFQDDLPLGFYMELRDLPDDWDEIYLSINEIHDQASDAWWFLADLSEQTITEAHGTTLPRIPEDSLYRNAYVDHELFAGIMNTHIGFHRLGVLKEWFLESTIISHALQLLFSAIRDWRE